MLAASLGIAAYLGVLPLAWAQGHPTAYVPGLGDLMNGSVQPHHIKLGLAGQNANWALAGYELDELREAFEAVAQYQRRWNDKPIAEMQAAIMNPPLEAVEAAIKAGSREGFVRAYAQVNTGCNSCHLGTERAFVVIRTPVGSPFADQEFRPTNR
jgi:hypothetical protein